MESHLTIDYFGRVVEFSNEDKDGFDPKFLQSKIDHKTKNEKFF